MINKFYFENFKSYKYAELGMKQFITLIGANASGKSNAVEGIRILSDLAKGVDVGSVLDGAQGKDGGIRGGAQGSKRFHTNAFKLGCRLCTDLGQEYLYEIRIGINGGIHIDEEALYLEEKDKPDTKNVIVFKTVPAKNNDSEITVHYYNIDKSVMILSCLRDISILSQIYSRIPREKDEERSRVSEIGYLIGTLKRTIVLSPDPSQMRDYNRITDVHLKMDASNISAVLFELCKNAEKKTRILDFMRRLPENEIQDISVIKTKIGDVIFALEEKYRTSTELVDAKKLSDGTLRCIAIITALLSAEKDSLVIIEEVDNGIHPSRLKALIDEVQEISMDNSSDFIATTHNSGLLDMYDGSLIDGVNLIYRESNEGVSKIVPINDIVGALGIIASEGLGDSLISQKLINAAKKEKATNDYTWLGVKT